MKSEWNNFVSHFKLVHAESGPSEVATPGRTIWSTSPIGQMQLTTMIRAAELTSSAGYFDQTTESLDG